MVDLLFEIAQVLQIADKTIVFQAVSILDRYYASLSPSQPPKPYQDCFLTGYTAFFIALKNSECYNYLRLSDVVSTLLCNHFSRQEILQKEFDIRKSVNY